VNKRSNRLLLLLCIVLVIAAIVSCMTGAVHVNFSDLAGILLNKAGLNAHPTHTAQHEAIVWGIRFPRVLLSIAVGSSLGICGAAMQGLFRNPLADPSIIGVSSGATLAAAITIVLGARWFAHFPLIVQTSSLSFFTFCGALVATIFVFSIAVNRGRASVSGMLLAGIAVNAFAAAFTGLLTFVANESQLRSLTFWTLGSLGGATWTSVGLMSAVALACLAGLAGLHKPLNLLSLGEQEAQHTGVNTEKLKKRIILFTAIAVGTSVALCGLIGFVGLVVPHLMRMIGVSDHRFVLPASAIGGAALLCIADTTARIIAIPTEVPVGVITALIGAPFFLVILVQQKQKNDLI
jgi:iron complex transport system permease protein